MRSHVRMRIEFETSIDANKFRRIIDDALKGKCRKRLFQVSIQEIKNDIMWVRTEKGRLKRVDQVTRTSPLYTVPKSFERITQP